NDGDDVGLSALNFDPSKGQVANRVAQDAKLTIDARDVTSAVNQFADKTSNLQLQLAGVGSATLTVARDVDALTKNFSDLVERYNQTRGALLGVGDAKVRSQLSDSVANLSVGKGLSQLVSADIGLSRDSTGKLYLNEMRLSQQALAQPESVNDLFNLMSEKLSAQVSSSMNVQGDFANVLRGLRESGAGSVLNSSVASLLQSTGANFSLPLNARAAAGVLQYSTIAQLQ
ncbi:MAG: flagellar filament capping protein FliD, partial [Deefgea sp.]